MLWGFDDEILSDFPCYSVAFTEIQKYYVDNNMQDTRRRKNDPKDRAFNSEFDHSTHLSLLLKRKETLTRHLLILSCTLLRSTLRQATSRQHLATAVAFQVRRMKSMTQLFYNDIICNNLDICESRTVFNVIYEQRCLPPHRYQTVIYITLRNYFCRKI